MKNAPMRLALLAPALCTLVALSSPLAAQGNKSHAAQHQDVRRHGSPAGQPLSAPEIDPALATAALTLVVGAALILTDRTRARGQRPS